MSQNVTPFEWTEQKEEAAALLAEDDLSDEQIAVRVGVTRRQLARWKAHPEFAARRALLVQTLGDVAARCAIARRERRVRALNERWEALQQIVYERGTDPKMKGVPGGSTGLLVGQHRAVGTGENCQVVTDYAVDTGLLKEMREHEKQAAQELGQWADKHEVMGQNGQALELSDGGFDLSKLTLEEIKQLRAIHERLSGLRQSAPLSPADPGQAPRPALPG